MRFLLISIIIASIGCAKQTPCNSTSTATINGQNVTQTNGACSATISPGTLTVGTNQIPVQTVSMCGQSSGVIYKNVIYNTSPANMDATSPTGFTAYPDNYYVFPTSATAECWFNVTSGVINSGAKPPTF